MSEFIGSRISLVSKSDIRYVGTLHEINSENSTVALENVQSFGTEGRKQNPDEELPASDTIFEYIVFRGSDVKDLRIEEPPKENKPPQTQIPNDPAILGSGPRPGSFEHGGNGQPSQHPIHQSSQYPYQQQQHQFPHQRFPGPPGPPGPQGHFPGQFGHPPGWFSHPGQGFPNPPPGPFPPHDQPPLSFGSPPVLEESNPAPQSRPTVQESSAAATSVAPPKSVGGQVYPVTSQVDIPIQSTSSHTLPAADTKPDMALASFGKEGIANAQASSRISGPGFKRGKIVPAVPLQPLASILKTEQSSQKSSGNAGSGGQAAANAALQYQNATQAATAAVAAAMAKLPPLSSQKPKLSPDGEVVENLTSKLNDMKMDDRGRHSRQQGPAGHNSNARGRGSRRGGRGGPKGIDVPSSDFDFQSANARFNKTDLVKEAIATGSPLGTSQDGEPPQVNETENGTHLPSETVIPTAPLYTKSSFFDNISSEAKEREDAGENKRRGAEMRNEERKRNMETFGLGSVDGGYRGGFRGRGRGGRGARGGYSRGRASSNYRGRGSFVAADTA